MSNNAMIEVEVVYAGSEQQTLLKVEVPEGSTAQTAIKLSGILNYIPNGEIGSLKIGIFSQICSLDTIIKEKDRIEIYRPLALDPKEARLKRVIKKK